MCSFFCLIPGLNEWYQMEGAIMECGEGVIGDYGDGWGSTIPVGVRSTTESNPM
jgi:hypothetical protein